MVTANQKSTIDTHTHTHTHTHRLRNQNPTVKLIIKSQENKKGAKGNLKKSKTINKMAIRTYISILTLNVNKLNSPIKRRRLAKWKQKQDPCIFCLCFMHACTGELSHSYFS